MPNQSTMIIFETRIIFLKKKEKKKKQDKRRNFEIDYVSLV